MAIYAVMGVQFFEGDDTRAKGNAVHIKQQSEALAAQSALVSPGLSEDMTSWFGAFEVLEDGSLRLESAWHLGVDGVVTPGLPSESADGLEAPDTPDEGGYPAWQEWDNDNANLYQVGDIVTHDGKNWIATIGNNHWTPGEYGWELHN